ncbi:MAG: hypothetical protein ACPLKS_07185, partial [Caldisericum exile]|uniref:hypothetical protein n=1 Tax=Caldisericum exile TaxID=693075 RepID=UPI003C78415D
DISSVYIEGVKVPHQPLERGGAPFLTYPQIKVIIWGSIEGGGLLPPQNMEISHFVRNDCFLGKY